MDPDFHQELMHFKELSRKMRVRPEVRQGKPENELTQEDLGGRQQECVYR